MTNLYYAIVTEKFEDNAKPFIMKDECGSKSEFLTNMKGNGYTVKYNEVFTFEEWELYTGEEQAVTMRQYKNSFDLGLKRDWFEENNAEKIEKMEERRERKTSELLA